jgi:hypothetical protein
LSEHIEEDGYSLEVDENTGNRIDAASHVQTNVAHWFW